MLLGKFIKLIHDATRTSVNAKRARRTVVNRKNTIHEGTSRSATFDNKIDLR